MRRRRTTHSGFTLIEAMIVLAIGIIILIGIVLFMSKSTAVLKRTQVRQQVMTQSRMAMDMIVDRLRNGKASTLVVSTPNVTPLVPDSRVDFDLQTPLPSGATAYAIYLANNAVYTQEFVPSPPAAVAGAQTPRVLASNVTGLMFTGNLQDLGVVGVTLRIDAPWDSSGNPTHVSTIILPNETVHLVESP